MIDLVYSYIPLPLHWRQTLHLIYTIFLSQQVPSKIWFNNILEIDRNQPRTKTKIKINKTNQEQQQKSDKSSEGDNFDDKYNSDFLRLAEKVCQDLKLRSFLFLERADFPTQNMYCPLENWEPKNESMEWRFGQESSISGYMLLLFLSAAEQMPCVFILFHFQAIQVHITFPKMCLRPHNLSWTIFLSKMRYCGKYCLAQRKKKKKRHSSHK